MCTRQCGRRRLCVCNLHSETTPCIHADGDKTSTREPPVPDVPWAPSFLEKTRPSIRYPLNSCAIYTPPSCANTGTRVPSMGVPQRTTRSFQYSRWYMFLRGCIRKNDYDEYFEKKIIFELYKYTYEMYDVSFSVRNTMPYI